MPSPHPQSLGPAAPPCSRPADPDEGLVVLSVTGALWVATLASVLLAPYLAYSLASPPSAPRSTEAFWAATVVAALATLGEGAVLAQHRRMWGIPILAAAGTVLLAITYEVLNVLTARDGDGSDIAAVPVLFIGIPIAYLALVVLSGIGYTLCALIRRVTTSRRR